MTHVIGVKVPYSEIIYYFKINKDLDHYHYQKDDYVVVSLKDSIYLSKVITTSEHQTLTQEFIEQLPEILRIATDDDLKQYDQNQKDAEHAFLVAQEKIQKHDLDMKLVCSLYTLDRKKLIFYFTAEQRIDFRSLVRDLASIFKTRIELRQIGVRDEAQILGGIGPCGRILCCSSFLGNFVPVSIKMAKDQNLSLNPNKISGVCGRLMCCLQYENDAYVEIKSKLPDIGTPVITSDGKGTVCALNILEQIIHVKLSHNNLTLEYGLDELQLK